MTVADADAEPFDFVEIVERRVGDDDAADGDGIEPRDRGQRAGAPDLDVDRVERGLRALGGEFVRDRPARRARDLAKSRLPVEPVDLVHDAVDVEGELGPAGLDRTVDSERALFVLDAREAVGDREAPGAELVDDRGLRLPGDRARLAPAMREEAQRALGGDARVLLAERAGGGVARVGELARLLAGLLGLREQAGVERGKVGLGHIDLAADLEDRRVGGLAGQLLRDVGDRADIGGDVLADLAVAAGQRLNQPAVLVAQRAGQAIDLGLRG